MPRWTSRSEVEARAALLLTEALLVHLAHTRRLDREEMCQVLETAASSEHDSDTAFLEAVRARIESLVRDLYAVETTGSMAANVNDEPEAHSA